MRETEGRYSQSNIVLVIAGVTALCFAPVLWSLVNVWWSSDEYGYGLLLPFVVAYIIHLKQEANYFVVENVSGRAVLAGLILLLLVQTLYVCAVLANLYTIQRYCFLLCIVALLIVVSGFKTLKRFSFVLTLLLCSIPLPYLINSQLTTQMQLYSTDFGVWFIRLFGVSVYQTGNVITMDGFQMLVAEACSGLRYLYPLAVISLVVSYFYRGSWLLKSFIVLMAVPITVLINSIRIAITGYLIKFYGPQSAQGFLHYFEGLVVFVFAFLLLMAGVWLVALVGGLAAQKKVCFQDMFDLQPVKMNSSGGVLYSGGRGPLIVFCLLLILGGGVAAALKFVVKETIPVREGFDNFPFTLANREIYPQILEKQVLNVLKADDYLLADYKASDRLDVNLYMAYYQSQKDDSALHSPRSCLPGGGWRIIESSKVELSRFGGAGKANRVVISKGGQQLLVYYWVKQMHQNYANELLARISLMQQSALKQRSDGALIRVISSMEDGVEAAETDLGEFLAELIPILPVYLPD